MTTITDHWPLDGTDMTPTATPGWHTPAHVLLSATEAAAYLLLAEGKEEEAAVKAVNRLVDARRIKPCVIGGVRRYARAELDRFIFEQTESWGGNT